MDVSLAALLPRALAAPEYRLSDYLRWLESANRGSGPMWTEYLSRDLMRDVPEMPVPMLLISGARDMNTPVALGREWFDAVEAPAGKRMIVLEGASHAPFLSETEQFLAAVRDFRDDVMGSSAN